MIRFWLAKKIADISLLLLLYIALLIVHIVVRIVVRIKHRKDRR